MEPPSDPVDNDPNPSNLNQSKASKELKLGMSKTYTNSSYPFVVIGVVIIGFGFIVGTFIRLISVVNLQTQPSLSIQPTPNSEGNPIVNSNNSSTSSPIKPEISLSNELITLTKFNQIQNGMTIQQIQELIGNEGKLLGSTNAGNISGKVYSWQNPQGSNAIVEFKNDQVVSKSQAGLK
jgi:hypothetical protein